MRQILQNKCKALQLDISVLLDQLAEYKDELWVLDFCDKLNELSIKY